MRHLKMAAASAALAAQGWASPAHQANGAGDRAGQPSTPPSKAGAPLAIESLESPPPLQPLPDRGGGRQRQLADAVAGRSRAVGTLPALSAVRQTTAKR